MFRVFLIGILSFLLVACSKDVSEKQLEVENGDVLISLNPEIEEYVVGDISKMARNAGVNGGMYSIKDTLIDLGDGYQISASLIPETINNRTVSSSEDIKKLGSISSNKATLNPNDPFLGKTYKVLVFTKNPDKFVAERTYVRGNEASTTPLKLSDGVDYVFVVFSLNDNSDLTGLVQNSDGNALANYKVVLPNTDATADIDLLYKKLNVSIPAGATKHTFSVRLDHQFNQVSVKVSSYDLAQPITQATGSLNVRNHKSVELSLGNNAISRPTSPLVGRTMPSPTLTNGIADTVITMVSNVNSAPAGAGINLLTLSNIRISGRAQVVPTTSFFPNQALAKGVRYLIRIKLNCPTCPGYNDNTIPTVRIGNQEWMRHNLEADYSSNPLPAADQVTLAVHGNYFMHGLPYSVASKNVNDLSNVTPVNLGPNFWLTESSSYNPCPTGFRVPTVAEFATLFGNTNAANHGNVTNSSSNFAGGVMLSSKDNPNIKLFFPSQGWFHGNYNQVGRLAPIRDRGSLAYYYAADLRSSTSDTNYKSRYADIRSQVTVIYSFFEGGGLYADRKVNDTTIKLPIKCIKN